MFWDTNDLWLDDSQTKKVKALRRKSNYYERKYDDLNDYLESIDQFITTAVDTYGIWIRSYSCMSGDVLEYKYNDVKTDIYTGAGSIVDNTLRVKRNRLKDRRDETYELYTHYYNRARREDY